MVEDYQKARKAGLRQVRADMAQGVYPYPTALDDILKGEGTQSEVHVGTFEIDLGLVAGTRTRGRQNVFSRSFMPLLEANSEFASKWINLYDAQVSEGFRDPIKVYEYLQHFYVQEGNKRVSVARYLDAARIAADVTRVVPMPDDEEAWALYNAFTQFFRVCPVYGVITNDPNAYAKLAELAGRNLDEPWPEEDVRRLRAALGRFTQAFRAHGGEALNIELGDAFVLFLQVYGYERACAFTMAQTGDHLDRIWSELGVAQNEGAHAILEAPAKETAGIADLANIANVAARAKQFRVAFVYDEDAETSGWVAVHEAGRKSLEERLGQQVATQAYPECDSDEAFDEAVGEAISAGADLVVTVQPTQMTQTVRAAAANPGTLFMNCSMLPRGLVRTFSCRMYEAKFLLGMAAAAMAENHVIGYMAESPVFSTASEINAFAIGVSMVDPHARVYLHWLSKKENNWYVHLVQKVGARVICGAAAANPLDPREPWGLFRVNSDDTYTQLARPVWDWGRYYELLVRGMRGSAWQRDERQNKNQALSYWWGMAAGVLDVELMPTLPVGVSELVLTIRQSVMSHRIDPFAGLLRSQEGEVQPQGAPRLSAEEIVRMDWFNWNVVGSLPSEDELTVASRRHVEAAGIIPTGAAAAGAGAAAPGPVSAQ